MLKNIMLYIITLLFVGMFAILYNEYDTGVLFIIWILFPVLLLILAIYSVLHLKISLDVSNKSVRENEPFDIVISMNNTGMIPISRIDVTLEYTNGYQGELKKEKISIAMDKRNKQVIRKEVASSHIGRVEFMVTKVIVYDFLHIWSIRKKKKEIVQITILPEYIPLEMDDLNISYWNQFEDGEVIDKKGDDPSEVYGIRDYMDGDRESRIHHKLSYKYDSIMVKEYSDVKNTKGLTIFDYHMGKNRPNSMNFVDTIFRTLYALLVQALEEENSHTIAYVTNTRNIAYVELTKDNLEIVLEQIIYDNGTKERSDISILKKLIETLTMTSYSQIRYLCSEVDLELFTEWYYNHGCASIQLFYVNDLRVYPLSNAMKEHFSMLDSFCNNTLGEPIKIQEIHAGENEYA